MSALAHHSLEYRAQTSEQKREVIERLHQVWIHEPEALMRLGQLLVNACTTNLFAVEDFDLIAAVERLAAKESV